MEPEIAVLAHSGDELARSLVRDWPHGRARLLTPATLSRAGLSVALARDGRLTWIRNDRGAVAGVLSLLSAVTPADLPHIEPDSRDYVASEMTAYLGAWLYALGCPQLNPPSFTSLSGELHPMLWRAHALAGGALVPACDALDLLDPGRAPAAAAVHVSVVGDRAFGPADGRATDVARAMSKSARRPMMSVAFNHAPQGPVFASASTMVDLWSPEVRRAIICWFES